MGLDIAGVGLSEGAILPGDETTGSPEAGEVTGSPEAGDVPPEAEGVDTESGERSPEGAGSTGESSDAEGGSPEGAGEGSPNSVAAAGEVSKPGEGSPEGTASVDGSGEPVDDSPEGSATRGGRSESGGGSPEVEEGSPEEASDSPGSRMDYTLACSQLELSNNNDNNTSVIFVSIYLPDHGTYLVDSSVLLTPTSVDLLIWQTILGPAPSICVSTTTVANATYMDKTQMTRTTISSVYWTSWMHIFCKFILFYFFFCVV